jgi:hypothetical protein
MNASGTVEGWTRAQEQFLGCLGCIHGDKINCPITRRRTTPSENDEILCVKLTTTILLERRQRP